MASPRQQWDEAMGVERVLELLEEQNTTTSPAAVDAYAIVPEASALPLAMACFEILRANGVRF